MTAAEVLGKPAERAHAGRARPRQGGQLRDHLRHLVVRPLRAARASSRDEAQALHRHLPRPLPARREFIERTIDDAERARLRRHAVRPPPADPRAARAELPACARWASGSPSTPCIQGSAADIIKLAMIAHPRRLRRRAACSARLVLQIHDELLLEVPEGETTRRARSVTRGDDRRLPARPAARGRQSASATTGSPPRARQPAVTPSGGAGDRARRYNRHRKPRRAVHGRPWNLRKPPTDMTPYER